MPKPKTEPLVGASRPNAPPAQLLGEEEVEALVARKAKVRKRPAIIRVDITEGDTPDEEESQ